MKVKLNRWKILIGVFYIISFLSYAHPIKLTSSLIEIQPNTSNLKMECRVFIDDFIMSIDGTFTNNINLKNLSEKDKKGIESYFEKHYIITINGKKYPFKYSDSQVLKEHNVLILKFHQNIDQVKKGDQLCIENKLFFEEFEFMQTNMITIRVPSLINEIYFEAISDDYVLPVNL